MTNKQAKKGGETEPWSLQIPKYIYVARWLLYLAPCIVRSLRSAALHRVLGTLHVPRPGRSGGRAASGWRPPPPTRVRAATGTGKENTCHLDRNVAHSVPECRWSLEIDLACPPPHASTRLHTPLTPPHAPTIGAAIGDAIGRRAFTPALPGSVWTVWTDIYSELPAFLPH